MISDTGLQRAYPNLIHRLLVKPLQRRNCSPDWLTLAGLGFSVLTGLAAPWSPFVAGCFLLGAGLCDTLDGSLAREEHRVSRAGAFLDSTLDRYGEFFVFLGCWWRLARLGLLGWGSFWTLFALQGSVMVAYAKARAESLGCPLGGGLFQRPERLLLTAVGLLASRWEATLGLAPGDVLLWTLGLLALGANGTAARRILRGRRALQRREGDPTS